MSGWILIQSSLPANKKGLKSDYSFFEVLFGEKLLIYSRLCLFKHLQTWHDVMFQNNFVSLYQVVIA